MFTYFVENENPLEPLNVPKSIFYKIEKCDAMLIFLMLSRYYENISKDYEEYRTSRMGLIGSLGKNAYLITKFNGKDFEKIRLPQEVGDKVLWELSKS